MLRKAQNTFASNIIQPLGLKKYVFTHYTWGFIRSKLGKMEGYFMQSSNAIGNPY